MIGGFSVIAQGELPPALVWAPMERLDSKVVYRGHGVDVELRHYRREDGTEVERQVVEHPGSVAIVAHDKEAVHLVAQPREAVEEDALLDIPAGTLDHEGKRSSTAPAASSPRRPNSPRPTGPS